MTKISVGDIGLVQIRGQVGQWIRLGQWLNGDGYADYEHAFVYVGEGDVIEAEPSGARFNSIKHYEDAMLVLKCPPDLGISVAAAALGYKGVPYSFLDYGALATHRLHINVPGLKRYIQNTGHMICSQLADAAANFGGWHIFDDNRWPGYVTPGALTRVALSQK